MSYVLAAPEMMTSAATDLATIGSDLSAAHTAAAAHTVDLVPAAADEVSASIAHLFSQYGGGFQALTSQAAAFHAQFTHNLTASAFTLTNVEDAIRTVLGDLSPFANEVLHLFGDIVGAVEGTQPGSLLVGLLIGIADQGFIALIDAVLFLRYVMVALHLYLTTGQILSWATFINNLFPPFFFG